MADEQQQIHVKPKRKRTPDYTREEIEVLVGLIIKNNTVLTGKHSSDITEEDKQKKYAAIQDAVNAVGVCHRTVESIKDKWQTLRKNVKAKVAKFFRLKQADARKTGGGGPSDTGDSEPPLTDLETTIYGIIPPEYVQGRLQCSISFDS